MNLLFRVDAGSSLGIGHVARCLTLAAELVAGGAKVAFACRELAGHQMARIAAAGHEVFALPLDTVDEMLALRAVLSPGAFFDWIVVDHYQLDATWETAARQWARRIMAIDDLADRPHACDLLLDQNFTASAARYQALLPPTCRLLAGPRYALLRPAFRREREASAETARRVLVSFGGFDQAGMTLKTLQALAGIEQVAVQCIAGQASADLAALRALVEQQPGWQLLAFVDDLAERMGAATLFIGAGGGTTWERAAMGLPSLCVSVADNQVGNAEALARAGVHLYLGDAGQVTVDGLRQAIAVLLDNAPLRQHFAARSRQLVDGLGARRVAVALLAHSLRLRAAEVADARLLFDGRNAESVRRASLQQGTLDWGSHCRWLQASLDNDQRLLLIGEDAQGPLGMLRYDLLQPSRARVSLYLFGGRCGLGWGRALLAAGERAARSRWPRLQVIEAQVLADNPASLTLFRSAGYLQAECHFERVLKDSQDEQF
ncbi:UDP-2,4-diacetamido-2,4,6-trideoxy-beta-L-altropyranose hydrolase [Pseudomonas sp. zfem002]|uniref:UDP-2,4-diacetamido-2,4, 6-trideoxy-beta-L-altropyranose hydrolase n=1 Tax=Pseudomonas sp. zfem002 TaxID=3078197 RepID=UPI00292A2113|nr:UDP-2,4-diacetamido-2,4,6-trideoxy-beta-L-altropyranose hydrolase [Pseudomonas sp. zfem002]MDU9389184.1 UDP-2,4-diacetamido-2,4,6-trideoxy-beta-L-altropyranose hydrolase [Pseudomonas sp. zfem002]